MTWTAHWSKQLSGGEIGHKNRCQVCGSQRLFLFLYRSGVPVHQNLVIKDPVEAINIARGELNFVCCDECGFVFNSAFDPSNLKYDAQYDNTQTVSPYFTDYVEGTVRRLVYEKGVRNCRIVEVGCGKGYFLKRLLEEDADNVGYGFDPAYTGPELGLDGRLKFKRNFYDANSVNVPADVVICRHVIEHIQDPVGLLRIIRKALGRSPNARVFLETPCVEWILRNRIIWDFFYEHCSLFSPGSLTTLLETAGFEVISVDRVFGDQYLWVEAVLPEKRILVTKRPGVVPQLARQFGQLETALVEAWRQKIYQLRKKGKIAIWGAGAKGVTLANLVDPKREMISCIVDLNPRKQGNYVPGTGHPIVDYRMLGQMEIATAILMNPNYREEIQTLLQKAGLHVNLVDDL